MNYFNLGSISREPSIQILIISEHEDDPESGRVYVGTVSARTKRATPSHST